MLFQQREKTKKTQTVDHEKAEAISFAKKNHKRPASDGNYPSTPI